VQDPPRGTHEADERAALLADLIRALDQARASGLHRRDLDQEALSSNLRSRMHSADSHTSLAGDPPANRSLRFDPLDAEFFDRILISVLVALERIKYTLARKDINIVLAETYYWETVTKSVIIFQFVFIYFLLVPTGRKCPFHIADKPQQQGARAGASPHAIDEYRAPRGRYMIVTRSGMSRNDPGGQVRHQRAPARRMAIAPRLGRGSLPGSFRDGASS